MPELPADICTKGYSSLRSDWHPTKCQRMQAHRESIMRPMLACSTEPAAISLSNVYWQWAGQMLPSTVLSHTTITLSGRSVSVAFGERDYRYSLTSPLRRLKRLLWPQRGFRSIERVRLYGESSKRSFVFSYKFKARFLQTWRVPQPPSKSRVLRYVAGSAQSQSCRYMRVLRYAQSII